jgi:cell wall-associated NlpC family hydrolase
MEEDEVPFYSVVEPVINLQREPVEEDLPVDARNDGQETQLLFNEDVLVKETRGSWAYIEAMEQKTFRKNNVWQGYPGWVRMENIRARHIYGEGGRVVVKSRTAPVLSDLSDAAKVLLVLSIGTRLEIGPDSLEDSCFCPVFMGAGAYGWVEKSLLSIEPKPTDYGWTGEEIIATARLFLGVPYLWGGRSMFMRHCMSLATGVDCSGLANLVFRVHGIDIPRDAHEQSMAAERIGHDALGPGDLIFVAGGNGIISHVMLYAGGEHCIEAPETGGTVRECTFRDRFGVDLASLQGESPVIHGRSISFGRMIPCPSI